MRSWMLHLIAIGGRGGPALCRPGPPAARRRPDGRSRLNVLGPSSFAAMGEALRVLRTGASLNLFGAFVIAIGSSRFRPPAGEPASDDARAPRGLIPIAAHTKGGAVQWLLENCPTDLLPLLRRRLSRRRQAHRCPGSGPRLGGKNGPEHVRTDGRRKVNPSQNRVDRVHRDDPRSPAAHRRRRGGLHLLLDEPRDRRNRSSGSGWPYGSRRAPVHLLRAQVEQAVQQRLLLAVLPAAGRNDLCQVKPTLCHYETCREPEWGDAHCMIPTYVYLAKSSDVKGASPAACPAAGWTGSHGGGAHRPGAERKMAGELEALPDAVRGRQDQLAAHAEGEVSDADLLAERARLLELIPRAVPALHPARRSPPQLHLPWRRPAEAESMTWRKAAPRACCSG